MLDIRKTAKNHQNSVLALIHLLCQKVLLGVCITAAALPGRLFAQTPQDRIANTGERVLRYILETNDRRRNQPALALLDLMSNDEFSLDYVTPIKGRGRRNQVAVIFTLKLENGGSTANSEQILEVSRERCLAVVLEKSKKTRNKALVKVKKIHQCRIDIKDDDQPFLFIHRKLRGALPGIPMQQSKTIDRLYRHAIASTPATEPGKPPQKDNFVQGDIPGIIQVASLRATLKLASRSFVKFNDLFEIVASAVFKPEKGPHPHDSSFEPNKPDEDPENSTSPSPADVDLGEVSDSEYQSEARPLNSLERPGKQNEPAKTTKIPIVPTQGSSNPAPPTQTVSPPPSRDRSHTPNPRTPRLDSYMITSLLAQNGILGFLLLMKIIKQSSIEKKPTNQANLIFCLQTLSTNSVLNGTKNTVQYEEAVRIILDFGGGLEDLPTTDLVMNYEITKAMIATLESRGLSDALLLLSLLKPSSELDYNNSFLFLRSFLLSQSIIKGSEPSEKLKKLFSHRSFGPIYRADGEEVIADLKNGLYGKKLQENAIAITNVLSRELVD